MSPGTTETASQMDWPSPCCSLPSSQSDLYKPLMRSHHLLGALHHMWNEVCTPTRPCTGINSHSPSYSMPNHTGCLFVPQTLFILPLTLLMPGIVFPPILCKAGFSSSFKLFKYHLLGSLSNFSTPCLVLSLYHNSQPPWLFPVEALPQSEILLFLFAFRSHTRQ